MAADNMLYTYVLSFIKIVLGIQKLIGGYTHRHTESKVIKYTYLYFFFQNKDSRIKMHRVVVAWTKCSISKRFNIVT
jgi:hypothetical protein